MERFRVSNGDIELLVYEKSFRMNGHFQTIYLGRRIDRQEAVKYAAMFHDIMRSGAKNSPDQMFKRTTTVWHCNDPHLVNELAMARDKIQDLEQEINSNGHSTI